MLLRLQSSLQNTLSRSEKVTPHSLHCFSCFRITAIRLCIKSDSLQPLHLLPFLWNSAAGTTVPQPPQIRFLDLLQVLQPHGLFSLKCEWACDSVTCFPHRVHPKEIGLLDAIKTVLE
jgi:hypothetical protein